MSSSYPGSKAAGGVAEWIISEQPPHLVYVEAFLGLGAVFRKKRRAEQNIGIEIDPAVVARWGKQFPAEHVINGDGIHWLKHHKRKIDRTWCIYLDPPYLLETRTRLIYEFEFATPEQHTELLELVLQLNANVLISGYASSLYSTMLREWRCETRMAMTRGGPRLECLWCNFPRPKRLHDARFAGGGFRERERIKRRKLRWVRRFESMAPHERQLIAEALFEAFTVANDDDGHADVEIVVSDDAREPGPIAIRSDGRSPGRIVKAADGRRGSNIARTAEGRGHRRK